MHDPVVFLYENGVDGAFFAHNPDQVRKVFYLMEIFTGHARVYRLPIMVQRIFWP